MATVLDPVIINCGCPVAVYIVYVLRFDTGVFQGNGHAPYGSVTFGSGAVI
jgi:hypothetical protein